MSQREQICVFILGMCLFFMFLIISTQLSLDNKKQELITDLRLELEENDNLLSKYKISINELHEKLQEYERPIGGMERVPERMSEQQFRFPIHEDDFIRYTSPYGLRKSPFFKVQMHHNGIDMATVWRAQVLSIADGTVIEHWPPPGTRHPRGGSFRGHPVHGSMIKIDHGDFTSLYAHLSETSITTGQKVKAGEKIGRVGNTGMSRGQHLHFELEINGETVNPLLYIDNLFDYEL